LAAGCLPHPSWAGASPRATATQAPRLSGLLQVWHASVQGLSQQTPSAQLLVSHSSAPAHASPCFLLPAGPATRPPLSPIWRRHISSLPQVYPDGQPRPTEQGSCASSRSWQPITNSTTVQASSTAAHVPSSTRTSEPHR